MIRFYSKALTVVFGELLILFSLNGHGNILTNLDDSGTLQRKELKKLHFSIDSELYQTCYGLDPGID